MNKRLDEIHKKNLEFEKDSPYNFCDRWCERCVHEKQIRCSLYKDELECKITCIANGKDEDDPEITKAVMQAQYKDLDEKISENMDRLGIDLDNPEIDEDGLNEDDAVELEDLPQDIQKHIMFVENNPLKSSARNYSYKAHTFLQNTFYKDVKISQILKRDFETVAWYHTLLPTKLQRALAGFHEPFVEGDFSLCDAIAQFEICKKAINESITALRKINLNSPSYSVQISELLALLGNIHSRIAAIEESI